MKANSIHTVTITNARDASGTLLTSGNGSAKVQVYDKNGSSIFAEAAMSYVSAGRWTGNVPASVFTAATAPWDVRVRVYDNTGATLLREGRLIGPDEWWN